MHGNLKSEVTSRMVRRVEGVCVKHYASKNSVKMYDKAGSVFRVETTINEPKIFRIYREVESQEACVHKWMPMQGGVVDFRRRTEISKGANYRYLEALSVVEFDLPSHEILDNVSNRVKKKDKKFRALKPIDPEESMFIEAIFRAEHMINGFRNKDIHKLLYGYCKTDQDFLRRGNFIGRLPQNFSSSWID